MASLSREVCICFLSDSEVSHTPRLLSKFVTMFSSSKQRCSSKQRWNDYALVPFFFVCEGFGTLFAFKGEGSGPWIALSSGPKSALKSHSFGLLAMYKSPSSGLLTRFGW